MKRRESLKALTLGSLAGMAGPPAAGLQPPETPVKVPGGRTRQEAIRDARLAAGTFFSPAELQAVRILAEIIIPADAQSGGATQAKVAEFIEFMAKDKPEFQTPLSGGLRWLNHQCRKRYGKPFAGCTPAQRIKMVDDIAYPETALPEMSQGVAFFNLMRNLTATGYFTSQIGIKYLDYRGNTPNQWEGVPEDVLRQFGFQ